MSSVFSTQRRSLSSLRITKSVWSCGNVIGSSTRSSLKNGSQVQQPPACGSNGSVSGYDES